MIGYYRCCIGDQYGDGPYWSASRRASTLGQNGIECLEFLGSRPRIGRGMQVFGLQ